ncbi:hypothetical protein PEL8287_00994 [Roseovarius litorisediminis]|uniref:Uncharacterized protein n=1 Tax=Roseovarius litorisediminis TaxID=1312363 RepID=A0A1Y5RU11_9RHOB|nr:hypothetical protein [Roseovarius litorisediminis]SLN22747.1 hypothetical protein PEL8287_00994 [Roseovarius litorisediminis]
MIIIVGLIIAFVLVVLFSNRRTRYCRWRAQGKSGDGMARNYKCMACGALSVTSDGNPPATCLRLRVAPRK